MQGSDNADIWRFERDQYRKQLTEAQLRIEELAMSNSDDKLTQDEAARYADQLRAMAASNERRALLAQELEACASVIVAQADQIEQQGRQIVAKAMENGKLHAEINRIEALTEHAL